MYQRLAWGQWLLCITVWGDVVSFSKQVICCCFLHCGTLTNNEWCHKPTKYIFIKLTLLYKLFLPFFVPTSLSESESDAAFALVFCLMKSSSLSLPFADSENGYHKVQQQYINHWNRFFYFMNFIDSKLEKTTCHQYLTSCSSAPRHQSSPVLHQSNDVSPPRPLIGHSWPPSPTSHHLTGSPCQKLLHLSEGFLVLTVVSQGHYEHWFNETTC